MSALNITCFADQPLTESMVYDIEVIQECYEAMLEGATEPVFLDTAQKYTKILMTELLEQVHNLLLNVLGNVIRRLHVLIVNDIRSANKYKQLIFSKMEKLKTPINYEYYYYDGLYEYPKSFKMPFTEAEDIVKRLKQLQLEPQDLTMDQYVDDEIVKFGKTIIDRKIDPHDLVESTKKEVTKQIRGPKTQKQLRKSNLEEFYKDMQNTIDSKKQVADIRHDINDYYNKLKRHIDQMYKADVSPNAALGKNPNFAAASKSLSSDSGDIAQFEMQRNRLFNAYIIMYRVAFQEKLKIISEKIEIDANVISTLLRRTSVITHMQSGKAIVKEENRLVQI